MPQPDRLVAQIETHERVSGVRGIALVEDQVDHREHGRQALGELDAFGHLIGQGAVADRSLGAHEPLGDRGLGYQKGARDLPGREAADQLQGQGDAAVGRQARMTAREDQPESVVRNRLGVGHVWNLVIRSECGLVGERVGLRFHPAPPPQTIDCASARRRDEPGARSIRRSGLGPAVERLLERFLDDLLGQVDVAHRPQHRRHDACVLQTKRIRHACVGAGALPVIVRPHEQRCYSMRRWSSRNAGSRRRPLRLDVTHMGQIGTTSM